MARRWHGAWLPSCWQAPGRGPRPGGVKGGPLRSLTAPEQAGQGDGRSPGGRPRRLGRVRARPAPTPATRCFSELLHGGRCLVGSEAQRHRLWVVGAYVLGVSGAVVLGAVVLGTVPAGAVVVTTPAGTVVVDADAGGEVVEVFGARGARVADC